MSRISCNVTKDLLPSYLDEICSEESKELVDEHLLECPACRRFMAALRERDQGKDAPELNFFRRVRRSMDVQSWTGILCSLALMVAGFFVASPGGFGGGQVFYYVAMPLLMVTCFLLTGEGRGSLRPEKKEWLLPIFAILLTLGAIGLGCGTCVILRLYETGIKYEDSSIVRVGPLLHCGGAVIAVAAFALLAVLIVYARKKGRVFPVSMNLACLAMNLVMIFAQALSFMVSWKEWWAHWNRNVRILGVEFVIVTALLAILRRRGGVKEAQS